MNFLDFEITGTQSGAVAHVTLDGVESDVLLMTASNVNAYKQGRRFEYWGGHFNASPAVIPIPQSGNWHVLVVPSPGGQVHATLQIV
jgi:hypothetical protein